ncbi:MAG: peptidoglycan DD-metalloendopeptidase family protein [Candidatus Latescibacteria bacterium]|nr:peptidoglycan DD-metalloendopeptidase family protein [Candidatus Latescibacterota bacterium]
MKKIVIITCLFLSLFAWKTASPADPKRALEERIRTKQAELESIGEQIQKNREQVAKLKGQEKKVLSQIHWREKQIDLIQRYIRTLQAQEKLLQQDIQRTTNELKTTTVTLSQRQADFARRLRAIYKHGRLTQVEILLSSSSFPELLRRYKYFALIEQQDKRDLEEIVGTKQGIETRKRRLEADLRQKLRLQRDRQKKQKAQEAEKTAKKQLLDSIRKNRRLAQQANEELQKETAAIKLAIKQYLEEVERLSIVREEIKGVIPAYNLTEHKGHLLWPVKGPVLNQFGRHKDKILKTWTFNRGIDIKVAPGAQVRAVAPGTVVLVDWFRGYGKFLLLYHQYGYFTLYGHLSEIFVAKGDSIKSGEVLATSGDTGSLEGPKLHLEILKKKEPLDPLQWLAPK